MTLAERETAKYLRADTGFLLPAVRAGVAELLEGGSSDALVEAVSAIYADGGHDVTVLGITADIWSRSGVAELEAGALWITEARAVVWMLAESELGGLE